MSRAPGAEEEPPLRHQILCCCGTWNKTALRAPLNAKGRCQSQRRENNTSQRVPEPVKAVLIRGGRSLCLALHRPGRGEPDARLTWPRPHCGPIRSRRTEDFPLPLTVRSLTP
ncbi:hypothetical protein AAFF_G00015160 [Aldrovandia affinis]|uniref:Uncharacterized protein n=1 Tax=Aldrovandia affinis TaxID=143900 RepID=A0AAD7S6F8_9TELE|nr:hypothetical protein AAFF_G00015160 [Aldrovandia affinis]